MFARGHTDSERLKRACNGGVAQHVVWRCGLITIVKIQQQYEGHGKHALLAALGSNMDYNKVCIAVDADVDIRDLMT